MPTTRQRDPEWISEAPIQYERHVEIQASAAAVWQAFSVNETWVGWYPGCKACSFVSDAPHGVGSIRQVHLDNFKVLERITAWEPNQRWAMTVTEINAPVVAAMAEEVRLEETDGGTRLTWHLGVELTRLGRPLRRHLVKKSAAGLETGLAALAAHVERLSQPQP